MCNIPAFAAEVLRSVESCGYEAWLVGGCVRDMLLGREPSDYDAASSAPPEVICRIFKKTVPTGMKYGTVTVFSGKGRVEVTSFRSEGGYRDFRRPENISFGGTAETDLSRRDFTVNAIAYNPRKGFLDPFGGRDDIKAGIIRTVGNAEARFSEDALRILRAYRFSARLGFGIEAATEEAARKCARLTANISGERVRAELQGILLSEKPHIVRMAVLSGALDFWGFRSSCVPAMDGLGSVPPTARARWAGFLHLCRSFRGFDSGIVFDRLKFDSVTRREAEKLMTLLQLSPPSGRAGLKRLLTGTEPQLLRECLQIRSALMGEDTSKALRELEDILDSGEPYRLSMLAVRGSDLSSIGIGGPCCGRTLKRLLDVVIENPELNRKEELLSIARNDQSR